MCIVIFCHCSRGLNLKAVLVLQSAFARCLQCASRHDSEDVHVRSQQQERLILTANSRTLDFKNRPYLQDAMDTWTLLFVLATLAPTVESVLRTIELNLAPVYNLFVSLTRTLEVVVPSNLGADREPQTVNSERLWFVKPALCEFLTAETKHEVRTWRWCSENVHGMTVCRWCRNCFKVRYVGSLGCASLSAEDVVVSGISLALDQSALLRFL